jgi:hypothetical protein
MILGVERASDSRRLGAILPVPVGVSPKLFALLRKHRREMAHRLAWGETFSRAVEHLPQRSMELRDSLRAG